MIANAIAEMRTYGEGFIIADQAPGLLDMSAIRNTNTKIILRLPDKSDRELVGRAANLNDSQIAELAKLPCGVAAVYQNEWIQPVLCKMNRYDVSGSTYSYTKIDGDIITRDTVSLIAIAEKLSNGIKLDKEIILTEILPILQKNCIASSVQIAIAQHLENPPR